MSRAWLPLLGLDITDCTTVVDCSRAPVPRLYTNEASAELRHSICLRCAAAGFRCQFLTWAHLVHSHGGRSYMPSSDSQALSCREEEIPMVNPSLWVVSLSYGRIWPCGVGQGQCLKSITCYHLKPTSRRWSALRRIHLCGTPHVLPAEGISLTHEQKLSDFPYLLPFHVL